jgi:hypothetical protein
MKNLKTFITSLALTLMGVSILSLSGASALAPNLNVMADFKTDACSGLTQLGNSGQDCSSKDNPIKNIMRSIISILSYVVGGLSIIMIVVSGLRFITSGGDSNKVSSAKSALIYALVGIAVAALAQALVHLVLYQSNKAL